MRIVGAHHINLLFNSKAFFIYYLNAAGTIKIETVKRRVLAYHIVQLHLVGWSGYSTHLKGCVVCGKIIIPKTGAIKILTANSD